MSIDAATGGALVLSPRLLFRIRFDSYCPPHGAQEDVTAYGVARANKSNTIARLSEKAAAYGTTRKKRKKVATLRQPWSLSTTW